VFPGIAAVLAVALAGSPAAEAPPPAAQKTSRMGMRGQRYCEVLLFDGNVLGVKAAVYNTIGLNECPDEAWKKLDAGKLAEESHVKRAKLNGPRYWMIDGLEGSRLLDPTPRSFGGVEMRKAGELELGLSDALSGNKPYNDRTVQRDTVWVFQQGKTVFELVDPKGRVFDMQSYSVQKTAQTEASLAELGKRLTLPSGWTFRTRVLTADLRVTAVGGQATVVQDDLENTYQLSQQ
jgi:hypothetical protein